MRRAFALYFLLIIITLSMSASDLDQIKLSRKQDDTIHQDLLIKLFQTIEFFFTLCYNFSSLSGLIRLEMFCLYLL